MSRDIRKGDRVRVTFEATVADIGAKYYWFGDTPAAATGEVHKDTEGLSIEKIEPPVETFGPGDAVKRESDGQILLLAENGWFNTALNRFFASSMVGDGDFSEDAGFTRVKLAEVPF